MVLDNKINSGVLKQCSIEDQYKKNSKISAKDIEQFREWVDRQPHLPSKEITDLDLVLMYHACQCSMEVSKQTLDLHYSLRTVYTTMFKDRSLDAKIENALHTVVFTKLPESSTKGATILYAAIVDPDPKKFVWLDLFKAFFMVMELYQYEEGIWPSMALIVDMKQFSLAHLGCFDPINLQRGFSFLQEAFPVHLTEFHLINPPPAGEKLITMLKPLLGKELQNLMKVHPNFESYTKDLPKSSLPSDIGGAYKPKAVLRDETWSRMKNNQDFFKIENKKRVNEALRPGGSKKYDNGFYGVEGSFKKLDLD